jgi:hypothetical protein
MVLAKRTQERIDNAEPNCRKSNTDMVDPMRESAKIDRDEPKRLYDRNDREEPKFKKSKTDRLEPMRDKACMENAEPKRA